MNILAIDTTTRTAGVSVKKDEELYIDKVENEVTHSEKILPLIDKVLQNANLQIKDISALACINGPGSFTGIRIGLATLKAISQVRNVDIFSINSLELIAYTTFIKNDFPNNCYIVSMLSTNNDRIFYSIYNIEKLDNQKILIKSIFNIQNDYIDEAIEKINDYILKIPKNSLIVVSGNCTNKFSNDLIKLKCNKYELYPTTNDCIDAFSKIFNVTDYIFNAYTLKATYARPSQAERCKNAKL